MIASPQEALDRIHPALLSQYGGYGSNFDDGTNAFAVYVEVPGVPGFWPDGFQMASVASTVQSVANMAELNEVADPGFRERLVNMIVSHGNERTRLRGHLGAAAAPVAELAAYYQNTLRTILPGARETLFETYAAVEGYRERYGSPEVVAYEPGELPSAQESIDRQDAAEEAFAQAVGDEAYQEGLAASAAYRAARRRYADICQALGGRVFEAERDFDSGIDRTDEVAAEDFAKFGA